MKFNLKRKIAGIFSGLLIASTVGQAGFSLTSMAAETIHVNGFTLERNEAEGNLKNSWSVIDFDGNETDVVIPDKVDAAGHITDNPGNPNSKDKFKNYVTEIKPSVFEKMGNVKTLKIPKYLTGGFDTKDLQKLDNLDEFKTNATQGWTVDNGVLYVNNTLVRYPEKKTGDYTVRTGTTEIATGAFTDTSIDKLTLTTPKLIKNEKKGNKFDYTLLGAKVKEYSGTGAKDGSLFEGNRLVAFGDNSNADLSKITSANPYAFSNPNVLKNANVNPAVLRKVPFSFYNQEAENQDFATTGFLINGNIAYCYNYGKLNPETVGDMVEYSEIEDNETVRKNILATLYAGFPYDAYGLLNETGVSNEAAKAVTANFVWHYETLGKTNARTFDLNNVQFGDTEASKEYARLLQEKIQTILNDDSVLHNFTLKAYKAPDSDHQGLVVIEHKDTPSVVKISKQDATTGTEIADAKLVVKDSLGNVIEEWVSEANKTKEITVPKDGTYTLTETLAPDGYKVAESITFNVVNGKIAGDKVVMKDELKKSITFSKVDITNNKELAGATLRITKDNGAVIKEWVSTDNPISLTLDDGKYSLTEETAPNGYLKAEKIEFEVVDGSVAGGKITMKDAPSGSFTITKKDIVKKNELPGAKLLLKKDDGTVIREWLSSNVPEKFNQLKDGNYELTETTAPRGYEVAETIKFTVKDGTVENGEIVMYDEPIKATPSNPEHSISKRDFATGKELAGAKLIIKDESGKVVDEWVSTNAEHKVKLEDGKYTLTEITAPKGYEIAETIEFIIKDGVVVDGPVIMYDKPTPDIPKKPHSPSGGYSGNNPPPSNDTPPAPHIDNTPITIITEKPTEPPTQGNVDTNYKKERTTPKTGDIVDILLMTLVSIGMVGGAILVITKKRKLV